MFENIANEPLFLPCLIFGIFIMSLMLILIILNIIRSQENPSEEYKKKNCTYWEESCKTLNCVYCKFKDGYYK